MLPCQLANLGKARGFNSVYTQRHLRQQARGPKNKRTRSLKPTVPDGTKRISYIHKKQKLQESKQSSSEDSFTGPMSEPATYFRGQADLVDTDNEAEAETYFLGHEDMVIDTENSRCADDSDTEELPMHHPRRSPPSDSKPPFQKDIPVPPTWQFQIDLSDILGRHRTDLSLYDELIDLVKTHSDHRQLKFSTDNLMHRGAFVKHLEKALGSEALKPKDIDVELSNKTKATVSVFDLEAMILSIINDETLMRPENMADGYDYLTGRSTNTSDVCGEVHTGDSWERARHYYCGEEEKNMPIALIVFGDKSHLDLHGSLSTIPVTFTLSCFNRDARGKTQFWRPFAYIPNLSYGNQKVTARDS